MTGRVLESTPIPAYNNHNQNVQVEIYAEGDIKDFISISDNDFVLGIGESKKIKFSVYIPKGTEFGKYDGQVVVVVKNTIVK